MFTVSSSLFRIRNIGVYAEIFEYFGNIVLAFYLFIDSTCGFWNTPLYSYLCRKIFVEDVRKDLFARADFSSYNNW